MWLHSPVCATLLLGLLGLVCGETLHGTTVLNWPYVGRRTNGQFEGFCVDLLNELAPLMEMAYTLRVASDGQYGGWIAQNGSINGMVGEVMRGEADFAIGDITVLTTRVRFVDFTSSFMDYGLSALVRRDVLQGHNIRNFKDLSEQTSISYGVKKHGANLPLFHDSPVVAKMYSYIDTHPSVFVEGEREGLLKVKREKYAFITESTFAEYVVQRDCDLLAIDDRRKHFQFEYAIAVAKNSPLKDRFSKAIRQLRQSGRIKELKQKYWTPPGGSRCNGQNSDSVGVTFADRDRLRESGSSSDHPSRRPNINDQYRGPHDEVDENEIELIRPRDNRNRRRKRVRNEAIGLTGSLFHLLSLLLATLYLIF